jgi:hypothetical protein
MYGVTASNHIARLGNPAAFTTLAFSLAVNFPSGLILLGYLALVTGTSRLRSIPQSFRNFNETFRRSDVGKTYIVLLVQTAAILFLAAYHQEFGETEIGLKRLLVAYVVVNFIWKYSFRLVLNAAALAALLACAVALVEVVYFGESRVGGPTNPIRFGMLAALFSIISLSGWMFAERSAPASILYCAGALGGGTALVLSGSRGAILALPVMLLPVIIRMGKGWSWSKFSMFAAYVAVVTAVFGLDVGSLSARSAQAVVDIGHAVAAMDDEKDPDAPIQDNSVHARQMLLNFAFKQFSQNILFGTGHNGWDRSIQTDATFQPIGDFNQAHNQIADDLAKGGLLRAVPGLLMILVPLSFFARSQPFADRLETIPALLGLITVVGFAVFSLTESVMVLSPTAIIYSLLLFYLLGAKEDAWVKQGQA